MNNNDDPHYLILANDIKKGLLVPVLGGDINWCGRPRRNGMPIDWQEKMNGRKHPPTNHELALYILEQAIAKEQDKQPNLRFLPEALYRILNEEVEQKSRTPSTPSSDGPPNEAAYQRAAAAMGAMSLIGLANICQYVQFVDPDLLDGTLPALLSDDYEPTPVHKFLVALAKYDLDSAIADTPPYPCIVTACFDQVLEKEFQKAGISFHLIAFVLGESGGEFQYTPPGKVPEFDSIELGSEDAKKLIQDGLRERPVILKLNGGFSSGRRNFAVTEDHFIDYLTHRGVKDALPEILLAKLTKRGKRENSHLLFMGFGLRNWTLRVILRRIWSESLAENARKRWTVLLEKDCCEVDAWLWNDYGLKGSDLRRIDSLKTFVDDLAARVTALSSESSTDPTVNRQENYEPGSNNNYTGTQSPGAVEADKIPSPVHPPMAINRDKIFFSYSHKDQQWLNRLSIMLAPVKGLLNPWDDSQIRPGTDWRTEIDQALNSAKAAVLLVSPDFLNSEFITKNELPPLLDAAKNQGCEILWIKVADCLVDFVPGISNWQALHNDPPLDMLDGGALNRTLAEISRKLVRAVSGN